MTDEEKFFIVTFLDEDDAPGIVASNWIKLDGKNCYYPNVRTEETKVKLLKKMVEPDASWPLYRIKILKGYETYGEARLYLKKAEETSNLESEEEAKRKRKKKNFSLPGDSSSDEQQIIKKRKPLQDLKKKNRDIKYPTPPPHTHNETLMDVESASINETPVEVEPAFISQPLNCPSDCRVSKQWSIQQCHLIQVVTDLGKQMGEVNRKLDLLLGRTEEHSSEDVFSVPTFLTMLPIKDDETFCNLNNLLKDNNNKKAMVKFLAGIGGKNARSFATNMFRRVLLDDVAEKYSLTGKQMKNSTKKAFLITETCKVIFEICKNMYGTTEENLKEIASDWLNQAKVRLSRRVERQKKKSEENVDISTE